MDLIEISDLKLISNITNYYFPIPQTNTSCVNHKNIKNFVCKLCINLVKRYIKYFQNLSPARTRYGNVYKLFKQAKKSCIYGIKYIFILQSIIQQSLSTGS